MAVLLALFVGAVSAADADIANGGMADIAVSPVSEDISVLADGEDPDDIRINSSDENQTVNIEVSKDNITVPGNRSVEFDIKVLNGSEELNFTEENLKLVLTYVDVSKSVNITDFTLNNKTISFEVPDPVYIYWPDNPNLSLDIFYTYEDINANTTVLLRFINATIEVPESIYVDKETMTGSFNIKVLDLDTPMNFSDKELWLEYDDLSGKSSFLILYMSNETLFKEGTYNVTKNESGIYIEIGGIPYSVANYTTEKIIEVINETDNSTINKPVTVYYPVAYTLKDGVISFRLPGNNASGELGISYGNETVTPITPFETIDLKFVTGNSINVTNIIQLDENKTVEFEISVLDKKGNLVYITEEDLIFYMTYFGDNLTSEALNIENFTFTPIKFDSYVDNETNITVIENVTLAKISFNVPIIEGNYTNANLNITFANNTESESIATKQVAFIEIRVLNDESATEYQNNYLVAQLWNNYLNAPVLSKTIYYQFINSSMGINWGYTTNNVTGKTNVTLDYIYSLGSGYLPVANNYNVILTTNFVKEGILTIGKNCTINITKAQATLSVEKYSEYYGSGKPVVIKLVNAKTKKGIVGSKITFKIYSNKKWNTATVTTGSDGKATIRLNGFGAGTYKVQAINANTGSVIATAAQPTITIKAIKNAKISAKATTAYYNYGSQFKVKMTNSKGVALKGAVVLLNIYTGKKYKAVSILTDDKGYAYWTVSGISIGKHKVLIGSGSTGATSNVVQTYITLKKGKTTVSAPKVINKYKKSAYFKITIKNKGTKKPLKGIYLKVKVYTGKKYKTYTIKTNSKGVASLNTKALKKGTHKVVITTTNKKYTVSKSGKLIVIK